MANTTTAQKKKALLAALEDSLGVVSRACDITIVPRRSFYNWYRKDDKFRQAVDEIKSVTLDYVESKLHEGIKDGNMTAIIFYLKTQGKIRGYVERIETQEIHEPKIIVASEADAELTKEMMNIANKN